MKNTLLEYVNRLVKVQEKTKSKLIIIPRIYTNKPRTTCVGYKGMLHQPNPEEKSDIAKGIKAIRKMHLKSITETGLTAADEMLYPENCLYLDDLLSYHAVGARSVENPQHHFMASSLEIATGMKNPTSGDLSIMLHAIEEAQKGHTFFSNGWESESLGNPSTHSILRGAVNKHGHSVPNYHYEDLVKLNELYYSRKISNPAVIIDTNHSNSNKQFKEQIRISKEIIYSMKNSEDINKLVKGLMIESYLEEGAQKIGEGIYGRSITDPCLGWDDSEKLLYTIADLL